MPDEVQPAAPAPEPAPTPEPEVPQPDPDPGDPAVAPLPAAASDAAKETPAPKSAEYQQRLRTVIRREEQAKAARAELAREREQHAATLELAKVLDSKDPRAVLESYARRLGKPVDKVYDELTAAMLNPGQPTVEQVVEQRLKAERDAAQQHQQQQQQQQVRQFCDAAHEWVVSEAMPKAAEHYPYLDGYDAAHVAQVAIGTYLQQSGQIPLDKILENLNNQEKTRFERLSKRQQPAMPTEATETPPELAGADPTAKRDPRKRPALNNGHAAQRPSANGATRPLTRQEIDEAGAAALRQLPGWR